MLPISACGPCHLGWQLVAQAVGDKPAQPHGEQGGVCRLAVIRARRCNTSLFGRSLMLRDVVLSGECKRSAELRTLDSVLKVEQNPRCGSSVWVKFILDVNITLHLHKL